ncbi:MAG TPA: hypothetical protein VG095_03190, partial [Chthoniobacterales bacterium]|nr:hypothetical protein [Chthoniobacterales bacterium]
MLFVLEGNRPPPNSAGEAELLEVMQRYGTLESPFAPDYLKQLLVENGLAVVGDYVSVSGFIDREVIAADGRVPVEIPAINYLLCKKVTEDASAEIVPDSRVPSVLRAQMRCISEWAEEFGAGESFALRLAVRNSGDTLWLGGRYVRRGAVMLGVRIIDSAGVVVDEFHGEPPLPRALAPNEDTEITIEHACPRAPGPYTLKVDLVSQHVCWFEEHGSTPLLLPLRVR